MPFSRIFRNGQEWPLEKIHAKESRVYIFMIIQEFCQFYYINNGQKAYSHFRFGWGVGRSACIYCNIGPNTYLMQFCKT